MGITVVEIIDIRLAQGSINREILIYSWKNIYSEVHDTGNIRRYGEGCASVYIMPQWENVRKYKKNGGMRGISMSGAAARTGNLSKKGKEN